MIELRRAIWVGIVALAASSASGATVQTVDDVTIENATVVFDQHILTVIAKGRASPTTMPLEDVVRITFREPAAPATGSKPARGSSARVRRTPKKLAMSAPAIASTTPTTFPSGGISTNWRVKSVNGDLLHGGVQSWADQHLIVRPDISPDARVELAAGLLDWMWHGDTADQAKAEAMKVERGDQDTAFVRKEKDGDIVAVRGTAVGVDGDELVFRYEENDRRINLAKIVGILFAQHPAQKAEDSFHQVFHLSDGEQISGEWDSMRSNEFVLKTGAATQTHLTMASVAAIDCRNGRLSFLSDLVPSKVEQTPFFDEIIPYKIDASLGGEPLKLGDKVYDKGLAVHSRCVLDYELGGRFDRFKTMMGFELGAGALGDAVVRVLGDGKPLYENQSAKGADAPTSIDVDLTGVSHLTLVVDFGAGQDVGDRVEWADARVLRAKVGG